jgi:50S ribosomal protein L16 3-hydroxylase
LKEEPTTLDAALVYGREGIPADRLTPRLDDDAFVDLLTALVNEGLLERDVA